MKASCTKVIDFMNRATAQKIVAHDGHVVVSAQNEQGLEIHDLRPLGERITNPIKGKGIVFYFGITHFVVTQKKLDSIKKQMSVVYLSD